MQEPIPGVVHAGPGADFGPAGKTLLAVSKTAAVAGGLVFVALVGMSIASIVGRKVASAPVPGDVEVLQMCAAFACATFFAYCHLAGGDVKVDFFTAKCRPATVHRLDALGSLLTGLVGAVLAWRSTVGAVAVRASEETSMILGWPLWVAQALMVPGLVLMALAGFYMVAHHLGQANHATAGGQP
ncbi:TRAP transporter small permease [Sphaerotilus sp.]|uniref:TRAP transporter small permease n=1 Tax=Sphaerotilus sp. TaxID=2093942 RepID=UPI0034E2BC41